MTDKNSPPYGGGECLARNWQTADNTSNARSELSKHPFLAVHSLHLQDVLESLL